MSEKVLFVDVVADVEHDAKVAIKSGNTKNQVAITRKKCKKHTQTDPRASPALQDPPQPSKTLLTLPV